MEKGLRDSIFSVGYCRDLEQLGLKQWPKTQVTILNGNFSCAFEVMEMQNQSLNLFFHQYTHL